MLLSLTVIAGIYFTESRNSESYCCAHSFEKQNHVQLATSIYSHAMCNKLLTCFLFLTKSKLITFCVEAIRAINVAFSSLCRQTNRNNDRLQCIVLQQNLDNPDTLVLTADQTGQGQVCVYTTKLNCACSQTRPFLGPDNRGSVVSITTVDSR